MSWVIDKPERIELDPATCYDLDVARIASEAESVLGYSRLKAAMSTHTLALVLHSLGIDPFDNASVRRYKNLMSAKVSERHLRSQYVTEGKWQIVPLKGYNLPIPEYVLAKALDIKEALPTAEFLVDELVVGEKYVDPFLIVKDGIEHYYIEVWDEPEFECI